MRIPYHKLVRDRIPEIIAADGRRCATVVYDDAAFRQALAAKLVEEAAEAQAAVAAGHRAELIKELADLYEVIDALADALAIGHDAIQALQQRRRRERGGFGRRLQLLWVESET